MKTMTSPSMIPCSKTAFLATLLASLIAQGETFTLTGGNQDWNGPVWGDLGEPPTAGNDYVVDGGGALGGIILRMPASAGDSTFGGDSLTLTNGGRGLMKTIDATSTVNGPVILDFGWLQLGQNSASTGTLVATELRVTGTGNVINNGFSGRTFIIDAPLNGDGDFVIDYAQGEDGGARQVIFNEIGDYSGAITVDQAMQLGFMIEGEVALPGSLTMVNGGTLLVEANQTLIFPTGGLSDEINGTVPDGTYTGGDLDALGFNYVNNGGTIVVGGVIGGTGVSLAIAPNETNTGNFDFTWTGNEGALYRLVSSTDLSIPLDTWDTWEGLSGLVAAEGTSLLEDVPGGGESKRFFAIIQEDTP